MKKIIMYMGYIILAILFIHYGSKVGVYLQIDMGQTSQPYKRVLFEALFPILAGIFFSLPGLLANWNKPGIWTFNLPKFIIIGIPSLIGNMGLLFFYFSNGGQLVKLFSWVPVWGVQGTTICGILFGFTLLSVLEKQEDKNIFIGKRGSFF
ncbi:MAG: hypothetical protein GX434_10950 [Peptococcaceae bacterium]|nr:hypothetical protein [Peptococcaceae bacterium]